ncbi:MAG: hypothetical protein RBU45_12630 [Myxococcota bacterium]|jgi:hypothetical protein|nr:hypothetical protein [Myxococcota bacterium]
MTDPAPPPTRPPAVEPPLLEVRRRELLLLHQALQLPPPVAPLWDDFPVEVERVTELSVNDRLDGIGLMTRGLGQDFLRRLAARLRAFCGEAATAELELLRAVVSFIDKASLFFKADTGPAGLTELSWYCTEGQAPVRIVSLLGELGVVRPELAAVEALLAELDAPTLFLGRSLRPQPAPSRFTLYVPLTDAREDRVRRRLGRALRRFVADPAQRDLVHLHHLHLLPRAQSRVFVSLAFAGPGETFPGNRGLKLDYEGVLRSSLRRLLAGLAVPAARVAGLEGVLDLLHAEGPGYLGLRLGSGPPRCRLYVPRDPMLLW